MATSQNALHHSVLLSNYAQDWRPPEEGYYVVPDLFPIVPVDKEFNDFARFNASTWRQTANAAVGPAGDVARVGWYRDADGSYRAKPYALEGVIDHKERDASDDVVQYEKRQMDVPLVTLQNTLEVDGITAALTTSEPRQLVRERAERPAFRRDRLGQLEPSALHRAQGSAHQAHHRPQGQPHPLG
jgi:hypothetical protein